MRNTTRHDIRQSKCLVVCVVSSPPFFRRTEARRQIASSARLIRPVATRHTYAIADSAEVAHICDYLLVGARWHTHTHTHNSTSTISDALHFGMFTPKSTCIRRALKLRTADRGHSEHTIAPALFAPPCTDTSGDNIVGRPPMTNGVIKYVVIWKCVNDAIERPRGDIISHGIIGFYRCAVRMSRGFIFFMA